MDFIGSYKTIVLSSQQIEHCWFLPRHPAHSQYHTQDLYEAW